MYAEMRERSPNFIDVDIDDHHAFKCPLCDEYHVVPDDIREYRCPIFDALGIDDNVILFHPEVE